MNISTRREGHVLVLAVQGHLDHANAGKFQELALEQISKGVRSIVIDFGGTTFLASMGFRALMAPTQEMRRNGGRMALAGLSEPVKKLFEVAGLYSVFQVFPSVSDAISSGDWPPDEE